MQYIFPILLKDVCDNVDFLELCRRFGLKSGTSVFIISGWGWGGGSAPRQQLWRAAVPCRAPSGPVKSHEILSGLFHLFSAEHLVIIQIQTETPWGTSKFNKVFWGVFFYSPKNLSSCEVEKTSLQLADSNAQSRHAANTTKCVILMTFMRFSYTCTWSPHVRGSREFVCAPGTRCCNGVLMSRRGWWEEGDN